MQGFQLSRQCDVLEITSIRPFTGVRVETLVLALLQSAYYVLIVVHQELFHRTFCAMVENFSIGT